MSMFKSFGTWFDVSFELELFLYIQLFIFALQLVILFLIACSRVTLAYFFPEKLEKAPVKKCLPFFKAVKIAFVRYTDFSGRSSRAELFLYFLFNAIITISIALFQEDSGLSSACMIFFIISYVPVLAIQVRRLHDVNRSGWWLLMYASLLGCIPVYYWFFKKSDEGENRFGMPYPIEDA